MQKKRFLFLFDFDHTIVHDNTDTYIYKLLPKQEHSIPAELKQEKEWNQFMRKTLQYYYHIGIPVQAIKECLQEMQLTKGFDQLFTYLRSRGDDSECVIISDSNTFFIDSILDKQNLKDLFTKIYTNPATIVADREISIFPHHLYHKCETETCPKNMCKKETIREHFNLDQYEKVCYFGDGGNDYCAATLLRQQDILFARKGFALPKLLEKSPLKCITQIFESGEDCENYLRSSLK